MRKKFVAYGAAALLIGFTVMMLPLALETGPPTFEPKLKPNFLTNVLKDDESAGEQRGSTLDTYGLASQPSNLLPSSLILLAGLIVAFSTYIVFKSQLRHE
ncbi:MAG TPA: hypothetical protein VJ249_10370 [Candidatus Bathyarchaeia archaeon]|nr:hypothetical protein [Candidatus Bathyarchaeia archaeon]